MRPSFFSSSLDPHALRWHHYALDRSPQLGTSVVSTVPLRADMSAVNIKGSLAVIWEAEQPAQGVKKGEETCHSLCQGRKDDDSLGHVQNE